jgi:hypothetical protein
VVVSGVDDERHRFFNPLRRLLFPHVVEHQYLRGNQRLQDVHLGSLGHRVIGVSNDAQQVRHLVEQALVSPRDQLAQSCNGEVGLADAVGADQTEPLLNAGKLLRESPHSRDGVRQLLVRIDLEVVERARTVSWRNPGVVEQPAGEPFVPAVTAHDPANTICGYCFPAGVVAAFASHGRCDCT